MKIKITIDFAKELWHAVAAVVLNLTWVATTACLRNGRALRQVADTLLYDLITSVCTRGKAQYSSQSNLSPFLPKPQAFPSRAGQSKRPAELGQHISIPQLFTVE
jgi:hypothetical protein